MKEKIMVMSGSILKFILFWGIIVFAGYVAFNKDPEINWIIRLIGLVSVAYFLDKVFYPERWKKDERSMQEKMIAYALMEPFHKAQEDNLKDGELQKKSTGEIFVEALNRGVLKSEERRKQEDMERVKK